MNIANNVKELAVLLRGQPIGSTFKIEGYVSSDGKTRDLTVRTLGLDSYAAMKRKSLELLEKCAAPEVTGYHPAIVAQARDSLMAAYRGDGEVRPFKDPYDAVPEGGYSTKVGEPSIYMLRLEDLSARPKLTDTRVDLVRAKAALVRSMDLPAGRYIHTVKLTDGKFKSVQKV